MLVSLHSDRIKLSCMMNEFYAIDLNFQEKTVDNYRTSNRHRWTNITIFRRWDNSVEGTRQIALVT